MFKNPRRDLCRVLSLVWVLLLVRTLLLVRVVLPLPLPVLLAGTRAKWWQRRWPAPTPSWKRPNQRLSCGRSTRKGAGGQLPEFEAHAVPVAVVGVVAEGSNATVDVDRGPFAASPGAPRYPAPR